MAIGLVGSGPATAAVTGALGDVDATVDAVEAAALDRDHDLAVVVGQAGDAAFERANDWAREHGRPWFAVELGGVGGYPVVDAAVTGFDPEGACYDCLAARVGANVDPDADPQPAVGDATARFAGALAGRRAVKHLRGEAVGVLGAVVEVPHAERELLPVPNCDCDDGRDRVLDRNDLERSLDRSLARAERGLDDRVGLVANVGEAESYPAPYYLAELSDTAEFSDATAARQAAGVDGDWDAAFMKALGEGLERYCAGVYRTGEFETGPAGEVPNAVPPSAFVSPDGDDWGVPDDADDLRWVRGDDLRTGDVVHLPAELVHYPPPAERIRPAITTGLGLGNATVGALLSGLYEVIERDAMTLAWYSTFDPLGLSVADESFRALARRARSEDLTVTPLLLTQDVDVPVVAVAVHREEWPRFALGTAAHLDVAAAARGALAEAVQNWVELRGMGEDGAADAEGAIGEYASLPESAAAFIDADQSVPADSVGPDRVPEGVAHLEAVVERATEAGMTPYAARTTTRDVQRMGFEAVRVLVPEAQPLFFGDAYFGDRAETVPADLGFDPALDRDHHPFP